MSRLRSLPATVSTHFQRPAACSPRPRSVGSSRSFWLGCTPALTRSEAPGGGSPPQRQGEDYRLGRGVEVDGRAAVSSAGALLGRTRHRSSRWPCPHSAPFTYAVAILACQPDVKICSAAAHFHGFGVARQGPWVTVEKVVIGPVGRPKAHPNT